MTLSRYYVGCSATSWIAFRAVAEPTQTTHGTTYQAVIGPFRTKRAARFMAKHGRGNPHLQTVADAERIAKIEENKHTAS